MKPNNTRLAFSGQMFPDFTIRALSSLLIGIRSPPKSTYVRSRFFASSFGTISPVSLLIFSVTRRIFLQNNCNDMIVRKVPKKRYGRQKQLQNSLIRLCINDDGRGLSFRHDCCEQVQHYTVITINGIRCISKYLVGKNKRNCLSSP